MTKPLPALQQSFLLILAFLFFICSHFYAQIPNIKLLVNDDIGCQQEKSSSLREIYNCGTIDSLKEMSFAQINQLRRSLMIHDSACYSQHKEKFIIAFKQRLDFRHIMLHIPKAGGTSVCEQVKQNSNSSTIKGKRNCWNDQPDLHATHRLHEDTKLPDP